MILLIIVFTVEISSCSSLTGTFCTTLDKSVEYCCAHSEEVDGRCVECDNGYTSNPNSSCLPCAYPSYGIKCILHCKCPEKNCDHILGCIQSNLMKTEVLSDGNEQNTHQIGREVTTVVTASGDIMNKDTMLYTLLCLCLVLIVMLVIIGFYAIKKRNIAVEKAPADISQMQLEVLNMHLYDEIDESQMMKNVQSIHTSPRQKLNTTPEDGDNVEDSTSSSDESDKNIEIKDYLNPYVGILQQRQSVPHGYGKLSPINVEGP